MATNTFWNGFGMLAQKIQKNREEEALTKALELMRNNMSADLSKWLNENHTNVTEYLKGLIEAQIGLLKNK